MSTPTNLFALLFQPLEKHRRKMPPPFFHFQGNSGGQFWDILGNGSDINPMNKWAFF
jgi:hypothetical protein